MAKQWGFKPGELVDDRYALQTVLRGPGIGEVWKAEDKQYPGRFVRVKFFKPASAIDDDDFIRAAKGLRALRHTNVVPVVNQGVYEGMPFVVSDVGPEATLRDLLDALRKTGDTLTAEQMWKVLEPIGLGVQAAHGMTAPGALVHGCLTPTSVIAERRGEQRFEVKVCDFALVSFDRLATDRLANVPGFTEYLAPEQFEPGPESPSTDVFALAVIAIELITLSPPLAVPMTWAHCAREGSVRAQIERLGVTGALVEPLTQALSLYPSQRFATAGAFIDALRKVWPRGLPVGGAVVTPAAAAPGVGAAPVYAPRAGPSLAPRSGSAPLFNNDETDPALARPPSARSGAAAFARLPSAPPPVHRAPARPAPLARHPDEDESTIEISGFLAKQRDAGVATVAPSTSNLVPPQGGDTHELALDDVDATDDDFSHPPAAQVPTVVMQSPFAERAPVPARDPFAALGPPAPSRMPVDAPGDEFDDNLPTQAFQIPDEAPPTVVGPPPSVSPFGARAHAPFAPTYPTNDRTLPPPSRSAPVPPSPYDAPPAYISAPVPYPSPPTPAYAPAVAPAPTPSAPSLLARMQEVVPLHDVRFRLGAVIVGGVITLGLGIALALWLGRPTTAPPLGPSLPVLRGGAAPTSDPYNIGSASGATQAPPGAVRRCPTGMVHIEAGTFRPSVLTDEAGGGPGRTPRTVPIAALCIDRTEVTFAQYHACETAAQCTGDVTVARAATLPADVTHALAAYCAAAQPSGNAQHPINCVSWLQADAYCRSRSGRLPTEDEWEYVAQGGDERRFPWGYEQPAPELVNGCGAECRALPAVLGVTRALYARADEWLTTAEVGTIPGGASPFHVLDMAGNVSEWTAGPVGAAVTAPADAQHVARGGGWIDTDADAMRVTSRRIYRADTQLPQVGFRCVVPPAGS